MARDVLFPWNVLFTSHPTRRLTPEMPARLTLQYIGLYWGYMGIMEKKMETTTLYGDYIGVI